MQFLKLIFGKIMAKKSKRLFHVFATEMVALSAGKMPWNVVLHRKLAFRCRMKNFVN